MIGSYLDPLLNQSTEFDKVQKFNPNHGPDGKFAPTSTETIDAHASKDPKVKESNATSVAAGSGADAGKVDAIVKHLQQQGFKEDAVEKSKDGNRFFQMTTKEPGSMTEQRGGVHHMVMVAPNGSWQHTLEGSHSGSSLEGLKSLQDGYGSHLPAATPKAVPPAFRVDDVMYQPPSVNAPAIAAHRNAEPPFKLDDVMFAGINPKYKS